MKPFTFYLYDPIHSPTLNIPNCKIANIDGDCCRSEEDFHKEISNALHFPEYYGRNLDSLFDCLSDLEWIENENIAIQFSNFESILSDEPAKSYYQEALLLLISDLCSINNEDPSSEDLTKKLYFFINSNEKVVSILEDGEVSFELV
ncbi:MAG: barstar family protein [Saprospiraceae bacterium]|nr:barstar family protein [Saprospiraceae bacterium]